ncbi:MAG: hypothetical protein RHS_0837 [Robinsoniella sp. RHS]|nr:MAG: hypothetical protein RHS_0837 [Robinsoniella sp. RHS]
MKEKIQINGNEAYPSWLSNCAGMNFQTRSGIPSGSWILILFDLINLRI